MALSPVTAELKANITEFSAKMGEARAELTKTGSHGESSFNKMASFGKQAFFGLTAAAAGFGAVAVHEAMEGEKAHAAMVNAIKNSGAAVKPVEEQVDGLTQKYAKLGFTNDQLEQGFGRLTQITHSTTTAMNDIGLAADLAATKHISLEQAATIVGKAANGNVTALGKMGVQVKDLAGKSDAGAIALGRLKDSIGGAAAAQADTFAGKVQALHATISNLTEKLGNALIPYIEKLAQVTVAVVQWFENHRAAVVALGVAVGTVLVPAIALYLGLQAKAFGEAIVGNIGKLVQGITALGTALTGATGLMGALSGGLILGGLAAVAFAIYKIGQSGKTSEDQIKHLAAALLDVANAKGLNAALATTGTSVSKLRDALQDFHKHLGIINYGFMDTTASGTNLGESTRLLRSRFTDVDKALTDMVKGGNADAAKQSFDLLAKSLGLSTKELEKLGALDNYAKAVGQAGDAAKSTAVSEQDKARADLISAGTSDTAADKVLKQKDAYDKLSAAVQKEMDIVNLSLNPYLQLQKAQDAFNQASEAVSKQLADNATSTQNLGYKQQALKETGIALTDSIETLVASEVKNKIVKGDQASIAAEEIRLLELEKVKHKELGAQIDDYINNHIKNVPGNITTKLSIDGNQAMADLSGIVARVTTTVKNLGAGLGSAFSNFHVPGFATGGWAGGLAMVGERGPELVNLPQGSYVNNAGDTRRMLGGGNATYNVNVDARGFTGDGQQLAKYLAGEFAKLERSGWKTAA